MKLSLIVCLYNTDKKYFQQCLNALYRETIQDKEIIIIDDGSTVDYANIIKEFPSVKYIKTNHCGTLSARLTGIEYAKGDYIAFVDSDDTMSFCYHEAMVKTAETTSSDIVFNDWAFHSGNNRYYCISDSTISNNFIYEGKAVIECFFSKSGREHSFYVLWNKIFKAELLKRVANKIHSLNLGLLNFAEDVLMSYYAFSFAKKVVNIHSGFYFYRIHGDQEINVNSKEKLKNHIILMGNVFDLMQKDLNQIDAFDRVKNNYFSWRRLMVGTDYSVAKHSHNYDLYELIKKCYHVSKLRRAEVGSDSAYSHQKVLPKNIDEIDICLNKIFYEHNDIKIYCKNNRYAKRVLLSMKDIFGSPILFTKKECESDIVLPKEYISLKQRIFRIHAVYRLGIFLFPKGSKIRKFLKSTL